MPRTVVLIDDEPDLLAMLRIALEAKDFEVHSATRGDEGLQLIRRVHPEGVITDLMMPGMSGLELVKRLRADPEYCDLPILVISALGAESDKPEEFWAAGLNSDDFISKPFESSELLGRLEYVLRKRQYVSTQAKAGKAPARKPVDLQNASPKAVVRAFIESWNAKDFETEFACVTPAITGGLPKAEYIARRLQVHSESAGASRKQKFEKLIEERQSGDEAFLVIERKDVAGSYETHNREEYTLKKTGEGWKIVLVRRPAAR